jgi:hypothetical protein
LETGNEIRKAIDKHYADTSYAQPFREHLGASIIGNACDRQIWYSFRWARKIKHQGRIVRLFSRGHHEEPRFAEQLEALKATISLIDPDTGKQWRFEAHDGHFAGSCDGMITGLERFGLIGPGVLEFKTHNDKSFKALQTKGMLTSKPVHYAQTQVYMHYFRKQWALYGAVNKNDDELHFEVAPYRQEIAEHLIARAEAIIAMPSPPRRISENPAWWECKWCDFYDCRTCPASYPSANGAWSCSRFAAIIPPDFAQVGCDVWEPIL